MITEHIFSLINVRNMRTSMISLKWSQTMKWLGQLQDQVLMDINIGIATKSDSILFLKVFINDFTEVELDYRDLETRSQTEIQPL